MLKIVTPGIAEIIPYEFDARKMWQGESTEIIRLLIPEGKAMQLHHNPFDVVFYVIKGEGELVLDEQVFFMEKDSCVELKTGKMRAWKNTGKDDLVVLVFKLFKE